MEYSVKYRSVMFPEAIRLSIKTFDRNEAISQMRDEVFFYHAIESWIEVDGEVIDRFAFTPEVRDAIKAVDATEA